jgi:putative endonuclease
MTYHVYIMASASRVLYTGVTNNIERRVSEHQEGRVPSFCAQYKTRELVYAEPFGNIRAAITREKQIKGWLRAKKVALVQSVNPQWKDLSSEWRGRRMGMSADRSGDVILSKAKNPSESRRREILRPQKRDSE